MLSCVDLPRTSNGCMTTTAADNHDILQPQIQPSTTIDCPFAHFERSERGRHVPAREPSSHRASVTSPTFRVEDLALFGTRERYKCSGMCLDRHSSEVKHSTRTQMSSKTAGETGVASRDLRFELEIQLLAESAVLTSSVILRRNAADEDDHV